MLNSFFPFKAGFILTLSALISHSAFAWDELRGYAPGLLDLELKTNYFSATGNFSHDGTEYNSLPGPSTFAVTNFDFGLRWTPSEGSGYYLQALAASSESYDGTKTRSNASLTGYKAGADFSLVYSEIYDLIADFNIISSISAVPLNEDVSFNSEGVNEFSANLIGRASWGSLAPFANLGYTYRDDGRSTLGKFSVGAEFVSSANAIGLDLRGASSFLGDDSKSDNRVEREIVNLQKNGGAYYFYAVNPHWLESNLWYRRDSGGRVGFIAGLGTLVTGQDYASGWHVFTVLNFRFSLQTKTKRREDFQEVLSPYSEVDQFQEEVGEEVDQELFRQQSGGKSQDDGFRVKLKRVKKKQRP